MSVELHMIASMFAAFGTGAKARLAASAAIVLRAAAVSVKKGLLIHLICQLVQGVIERLTREQSNTSLSRISSHRCFHRYRSTRHYYQKMSSQGWEKQAVALNRNPMNRLRPMLLEPAAPLMYQDWLVVGGYVVAQMAVR